MRTATLNFGTSRPSSAATDFDLGERPLQVLMDVDGERLEGRYVDDLHAATPTLCIGVCSYARYRESIATRKPVSVLPDPVGAAMRVLTPDRMWGHPSSCGSEGPRGNCLMNQAAHGRVKS